MLRFVLTLLCACTLTPNWAGEVLHHDIQYQDKHYVLDLDMRIVGEHNRVRGVLLDFPHLTQLNNTIKVSKLLFSSGNVHSVLIETEGCVLFYCKRVKQVQLVTEIAHDVIQSTTDPDESDFHHGQTQWQLFDEGKHTRIHYHSDFVPKFWIPPLIGPAILKSRLLEEAQKTLNGIERQLNPPVATSQK